MIDEALCGEREAPAACSRRRRGRGCSLAPEFLPCHEFSELRRRRAAPTTPRLALQRPPGGSAALAARGRKTPGSTASLQTAQSRLPLHVGQGAASLGLPGAPAVPPASAGLAPRVGHSRAISPDTFARGPGSAAQRVPTWGCATSAAPLQRGRIGPASEPLSPSRGT